MRRHVRPVAPVDDQRLVTEPHGDAGGIHRRVAAAVDGHPAPHLRCVAHLDVLQEAHRIQDLAGVAGGDVGPLRQMRADGDEHRVEIALLLFGDEILDLVVEDDLDAHPLDPGDLAVEDVARQTVRRDAEVHHATGDRARLVDLDGVPHQRQMMGAGQAAGTRSNDQDALARRLRGDRRRPLLFEGKIAEEALDGMDGDGTVKLGAVAVALTRMVADPAVDRRHRVVLDDRLPRLAEASCRDMRQPGLDVLARRTGVVARRQHVQVDRTLNARVRCRPLAGQIRWTGQVGGLLTHRELPPLSSSLQRWSRRSSVASVGSGRTCTRADATTGARGGRLPLLRDPVLSSTGQASCINEYDFPKHWKPCAPPICCRYFGTLDALCTCEDKISSRTNEAPEQQHHSPEFRGKQGRTLRPDGCVRRIANLRMPRKIS